MTRSAATDPPLLKLSTPDDILATVPYLLGFHPVRSLVVIGLRGERSRVGMSMRMDIDGGPPDEMAATVLRALTQDGAQQVLLVLYDPDDVDADAADPDDAPSGALLAELGERLQDAGLRVRDALAVQDGRWRSYLCDDDGCCPPEGRPLRDARAPGGASVVDATAVSAGMTALPDREALQRSLEPPTPWCHAATAQAADRLFERLLPRLVSDQLDVEDELLAAIEALIPRFTERTPSLSDDEVATVSVALALIEVRDTVITWGLRDDVEALRRLLLEVVRRTGAPEHVPVATVLAWLSYLQGSGGLANCALELVFRSDPEYSLALLVDRMLQGGLHPDVLRKSTADTAAELVRRRRDRRRAAVGAQSERGSRRSGSTRRSRRSVG